MINSSLSLTFGFWFNDFIFFTMNPTFSYGLNNNFLANFVVLSLNWVKVLLFFAVLKL
jgi:hypothetical protein